MRGRVRKDQTAVYINYEHSDFLCLISLKDSLNFFSAVAPFVQYLSAVQAENMTSHPFEGREESKRAKRKSLRKGREEQGADL